MSDNNNHSYNILAGAIVGGILAGASIAFFNSQAGRKFTYRTIKKVKNLSEDFGDSLESICKKNKYLGKGFGDRVECWTHDTTHFLGTIAKGIGSLSNNKMHSLLISVLIGTAVGGGVAALASHCREEKHEGFMDNLACRAASLGKVIQDLMDTAQTHRFSSNGSKSKMDDIADFAAAGMQLWQKMKQR